MKQVFTTLLLICFSVQITGYHIFFHFRQGHIKKAAQRRVRNHPKEEESEHFVFSELEIEKLVEWEGQHEFRYGGEMYDIIEKRVEDGKVFIHCINDKKESELVKNYKNLSKDDFGNTSKKRTSLLLKLIGSFYTSLCNEGSTCKLVIEKRNWVTHRYRLLSSIHEVITPPPQFT